MNEWVYFRPMARAIAERDIACVSCRTGAPLRSCSR